MYKGISIDNNGDYIFITGNFYEDLFSCSYNKEQYEFLIDLCNNNLETIRSKCALKLFENDFEQKLSLDTSPALTYEQAYNQLKDFISISEKDRFFIKNFIVFITSDAFSSSNIIERISSFYSEDDNLPWNYMNASTSEYTKRIVLLEFTRILREFPYEKCFSPDMCKIIHALERDDLEEPLTFIPNDIIEDRLAFDVRISTRTSEFSRRYVYTFSSMMDVILFELYNIINNNITLKLCKNCGKLFIPQRSDALYCDNPAPQNPQKNCKEYGGYMQRQENIRLDLATQLYRRLYTRKQMKAKRHPENEEFQQIFHQFKAQTQDWKKRIKAGKATNDDFTEWLTNQS